MDIFVSIIIASIVVLAVTLPKVRPLQLQMILFFAYALRITVLCLDHFQVFTIPFTGTDTENFHAFTLRKLNGEDVNLTYYTVFLAWIYELFPSDGRFMAQFINVLFSYGMVFYVYMALKELNISTKKIEVTVLAVTFMPVLICFSGVLLREAWCEFFVTMSAYYMIVWYKKSTLKHLMVAFVSVLLAMVMHSGLIGVMIGYLLAVLGNKNRGVQGCSFKYLFTLVVVVAIVVLVVNANELFLGKFNRTLESEEFYLDKDIIIRKGGSSYLLWLEGKSTVVGLLFAPLKMFYFLFSPLPWNWRNFMDILTFVIDGLFYAIMFYGIFHVNFKDIKRLSPRQSALQRENADLTRLYSVRKFLLYSILLTTFIFATSIFNAGTAIRHRAKFVPVVAIACAVSMELRIRVKNHKKTLKMIK